MGRIMKPVGRPKSSKIGKLRSAKRVRRSQKNLQEAYKRVTKRLER